MRVLNINLTDTEGGAAIAASRLMRGMHRLGHDVSMLVRRKYGEDPKVSEIFKPGVLGKGISSLQAHLDEQPLRLYSERDRKPWSLNWVPSPIARRVEKTRPDIVHLHWVGNGFVPIQEVKKFKKPLLWTLHDSWALTGGCHIPSECKRYKNGCGSCPQLCSSSSDDLSAWTWRRKARHWKGLDLTIVCPSRWLAGVAKSSPFLKDYPIEVIPNGLDLATFKPHDKLVCRDLLGLPADRKLILFGAVSPAHDKNKGGDLLLAALKELSSKANVGGYGVVVFGSATSDDFKYLPFEVFMMGRLRDEFSMAALYSAVDVTVVPSRQEAFGQVASESMACGTPVVAFGTSGLLDIVDHQVNGYLASPYDSSSLAEGIEWVLRDDQLHHDMSLAGVEKARKYFSLDIVANQYADLYQKVNRRVEIFEL